MNAKAGAVPRRYFTRAAHARGRSRDAHGSRPLRRRERRAARLATVAFAAHALSMLATDAAPRRPIMVDSWLTTTADDGGRVLVRGLQPQPPQPFRDFAAPA